MKKKRDFRKILSIFGPAYLVSVGYMDPGNWATDIAGGSKFGYQLIWVLLMSNIMAIILQILCTKIGIVTEKDLAQLCRLEYSKKTSFTLWILAELAIIATDLAEVLGTAIGLYLLFRIPILWGIVITAFDTVLILALHKSGKKTIEIIIISLISIIAVSFLIEILIIKPDFSEVVTGFIPKIANNEALYIAIGIIGATVMPHNLYLHSNIVINKFKISKEKKMKYSKIDSILALNLAFFVNAAILILAATTFYKKGYFNVNEIQDAYHLLEPLLGTNLAPILFGVALLAAGQSSTITGTMSGQIVMEGFIKLKISPWKTRIITRLLAITPAIAIILIGGTKETGDLLVFSQVLLSLQLPFAVIPLIHFVSSKKLMGKYVINNFTRIFSWFIALIIIILNIKLVFDIADNQMKFGINILGTLLYGTLFIALLFLGYIFYYPIIKVKKLEAGK
ncbi:MAG: Nramp family divalent metal transporter [Sebaldella sp.]|nr:Nramp family divalent metal transporter [Sebaldella sp.]